MADKATQRRRRVPSKSPSTTYLALVSLFALFWCQTAQISTCSINMCPYIFCIAAVTFARGTRILSTFRLGGGLLWIVFVVVVLCQFPKKDRILKDQVKKIFKKIRVSDRMVVDSAFQRLKDYINLPLLWQSIE